MFNCEKLKNENCALCNQGIVQDVHVREKKIIQRRQNFNKNQQSKCSLLLLIKPVLDTIDTVFSEMHRYVVYYFSCDACVYLPL